MNGFTVPFTQQFGAWRGSPVTMVNAFMPKGTWDQMANPTYGGPNDWVGQHVHLVWSVTMLPNSGGSIQTGATGAYNGYFASMARRLVADGQGSSDIRLGWEMNGNWFSWSGAKDPTAWIAYWRQVVTTMRAVPGANFLFDWSPSNNWYYNSALLYPGDSYVDEVGQSVYDQTSDIAESNTTGRWNVIYNGEWGSQGLAWLAGFASQHGKPTAFAEWGLSARCDHKDGGDDPYFVQQMHNFFTSHYVRFETYFNDNPSSCEVHQINGGYFPRAAALYRQLWQPTPVAPPAPGSEIIDVSASVNRSSATKLSGAVLHSSSFYAFVSGAPTGTTSISFYLDKLPPAKPTHVENWAPWDFAGGTPAAADPTRTAHLANGLHVLTAVITGSGGTQTIKATFTVPS